MDGGERPPPTPPGAGKRPSGDEAPPTGAAGAAAAEVHEIFGDGNLVVSMFVLLLLGLMQRLMAPPCTC